VPVAQVTVDVLAAHLADYPAGLDELIFTNNPGEPWRRGTFSEIIRNARAAADLAASLTFHDLRHHFASVLIAAGCSIKGGPGSTRPRQRQRDPRHLLAPVAGRRRPHPGRRAIPPRPDTSARVAEM
jgi:integrase